MLCVYFAICSVSISQYPCERAVLEKQILGLFFLDCTVLMKDPEELNINSSERRLKGEAVPIHTDMKRTSNNARIINLPRAQQELEAKDRWINSC